MDDVAKAKADARRKRDEATQRAYRRKDRRFHVTAVKPGAIYRVTEGHDRQLSREYFAKTCDDAMTQHVNKWGL